jgi:hypothetical protein
MRARRHEIVDEYVEDGRAAVYTTTGMVVLLSELATVAWSVLGDEWASVTAVAEALVARFGEPGEGDPDALTENALRSLADLSLVDLDEAVASRDPADAGRG